MNFHTVVVDAHTALTILTRAMSALPGVRQLQPDAVGPLDQLAIHRKCERAFRLHGFDGMPPNPYPVGDIRRAVWVERTSIILRRERRRLEAGGGHREENPNDDWLRGMFATDWGHHFDEREPALAQVIRIADRKERNQ